MNNQETLIQLESLKMKGMAQAFSAIMNLAPNNRPPLEQIMAKMVESEILFRNERKMTMCLKTSRLRYNSVLEEVICSEQRNLTKEQLLELSDCSFVRRAENILITGKTGCGKSYLACAIGKQACHMGIRTEYFAMNKFIEKIAMAKIEGSFIKVINHIEKNDLIIFDDFGLQPLDTNSRLALLQILEDFYERKSVIITSQLPVKNWYDYIGEPTLADAIMDHITSNSIRVEIKGESMRRKEKKN